MIITKLIGGNGNQMFQYAAGLSLARRHNTELLLDINYLTDKSKRYFRHVNRDYALGMFNISGRIAENREISRFTVPRSGNKYIYYLKRLIFANHNVFTESVIDPGLSFDDLPDNSYLEGYWQDPVYFSSVVDNLKQEFTFKKDLPEECQSINKAITESESVGIIFRRGDYVSHPLLDVVRMDYYYRAIEIIARRAESPRYFVFSDDIAWCKNSFLPTGINITFVDQELTGPLAAYYLKLISECHHYIIPNSTFGWWGAWLGKCRHKIVIAPKIWFNGQQVERNSILPKEWIAL